MTALGFKSERGVHKNLRMYNAILECAWFSTSYSKVIAFYLKKIHLFLVLHLQLIKSSFYWIFDFLLKISVLWHKLRAVCASLSLLLESYLYSKFRCALISCHHYLPSLLSCQVTTICYSTFTCSKMLWLSKT